MRDYGISYTDKELRAFFNYLDVNRLLAVSFDTFYIFVKGELSPIRKQLVETAFAQLDTRNSGTVLHLTMWLIALSIDS